MNRFYFCDGCDRRIPERDCKDGMRCECGETRVRLLPKSKKSWTSRAAKSVEVTP